MRDRLFGDRSLGPQRWSHGVAECACHCPSRSTTYFYCYAPSTAPMRHPCHQGGRRNASFCSRATQRSTSTGRRRCCHQISSINGCRRRRSRSTASTRCSTRRPRRHHLLAPRRQLPALCKCVSRDTTYRRTGDAPNPQGTYTSIE